MVADTNQAIKLRTPSELVIKTIATHAFALTTYTYSALQLRRPVNSHLFALRLLFFAFVPTLPLAQLLIPLARSLVQFLRNNEDDDALHFRFYLSAAMGMHASARKSDDEGVKGQRNGRVSLLDVGSHCVEKEVIPFGWVWVGKAVAAALGMTQAILAIIVWVRRMNTRDGDTLSYDHRNGAMGVASVICAAICCLTLLIRLNWNVSKAFEAPQKGSGIYQNPRSRFMVDALLAMVLHLVIAAMANEDNIWLYSSVGSVAWLFTARTGTILQGWQTLVIFALVYVFRHEISRRLGLKPEHYAQYFAGRRWHNMKALAGVLGFIWVVVDILWLFIADTLQVMEEAKHPGPFQYYVGYWWLDPLSKKLVLL